MSMRLTDICAAIASELTLAGIPAVYPSPPAGRIIPPLIVVFSGAGNLSHGSGEQYLLHTVRARIYATTSDVPSALESIDAKLEDVVDWFDPKNPDAYHLRRNVLGKSVDFCRLLNWELSNTINVGEKQYLGGDLFFDLKVRRFRGDA